MRVTCLVNNYNYGEYIGEAVASVLSQTAAPHEVIVVDDGSTDGSLRVLAEIGARDSRVMVVEEENNGQLSAFEAGFARATGDIVFFLDADDVYEPDYISRMLGLYDARPEIDFAFCGAERFGSREGVILPHPTDRDLGCSAVATALDCRSVGAATSCLSMRRWVLERVLPGPSQEEWRISADACLVYGSSLAGARKYAVAEPLVRRRFHETNRFENRPRCPEENYRRRLRVAGLVGHYARRFGLDDGRLVTLSRQEFRTIPRPSFRELKHYSRIAASNSKTWWGALWQVGGMVRHFAGSRKVVEAAPEFRRASAAQPTRQAA